MSHIVSLARPDDVTLSPLDGRGHYTAYSSVANETYSLGEQEAFLLSRLDGRRSTDDLCAAFEERFNEPLSSDELNEFLRLARNRRLIEPAEERKAQRVVQDFVPMAQSLEWRLSRAYWATRGVLPFLRQESHCNVNNDGRASQRAAAVLFASCEHIAHSGAPIAVLELGAGCGLFARLLLDEFRRLCTAAGTDYYDRLTYYITDGWPMTIEQWTESGIFAPHEGHVVTASCDAQTPGQLRNVDGARVALPQLSAVFINYMLDQLPADILCHTQDGCSRLCVRTLLTNDAGLLRLWGNPTVEAMRALAESNDPADEAKLLRHLPLFEFETAYCTFDETIPFVHEALSIQDAPPHVVVSHGAVFCVSDALRLLRDDGFMLIRDMGTNTIPGSNARFPMRLASSIQLPVNSALLSRLVAKQGWDTVETVDREEMMETWLLCRCNRSGQLPAAFQGHFRRDGWEDADQTAAEARGHKNAGRQYEALDAYRRAQRLAPGNWWLLGEMGEFIGLTIGDADTGLELVEKALGINPWTSPYLWAVKGDCLRRLARWDEAHDAYCGALALDEDDVRAAAGMADRLAHSGDEAGSLAQIARALAADFGDAWRGKLLAKQQQVLAGLSARHVVEQEHLRKRNAAFMEALRSEPRSTSAAYCAEVRC